MPSIGVGDNRLSGAASESSRFDASCSARRGESAGPNAPRSVDRTEYGRIRFPEIILCAPIAPGPIAIAI